MSLNSLSFDRYFYITLLVLCILSRLVTSIFYIEDIDSLRFALAANDYDVLSNRPHFPGYPLYCFILSSFYSLLSSLGFAFSLIGGIFVFVLIYFTGKTYQLLTSKESYIPAIILFFNPFVWIMSNRYMPDLMGLSLLVMGIYYFIHYIKTKELKSLIFLGFSLGCLSGVRLSYLPFFLPVVVLFLKTKTLKPFLLSGIIFFLVWFVPWIIVTDASSLYELALNDANGHFYRWGGTVLSHDAALSLRIQKIIEALFADSFGFWWTDRNWMTIINTVFLSLPILITLLLFRSIYYKNKKEIVLITLCLLCYFLWALFFQNVVYKPRHMMPFIPFLVLVLAWGIDQICAKIDVKWSLVLCSFLLGPYIIISSKLITQHKDPSALAQIKNFIEKNASDKTIVVSNSLKNYYFRKSIDSNIVYLNDDNYQSRINNYYQQGYKIYSTFSLSSKNFQFKNKTNFYHNPYVNKLWSSLRIYEYEK